MVDFATLADLDELADRWVDLAHEQRPHGSYIRAFENRDVIRTNFARHIVDDGVLVDRADGRIVGFVMFEVSGGDLSLDVTRGMIHNLYVVPEYRNAGRGPTLLAAAEAALQNRGVDSVQLEVMAGNERARSFYAREGYEEHRVVMEKRVRVESDTNAKDHD
ncbi:GNAT family N-acetyltransferase [Haloarchaeobius sp. TZWWS8]|uniref:GNAT family N-acetyltransferase n=1 Tax=Haloarchaeobius sp. TZWWS8 TaxID=3446121 RepID=UPI003EC02AB7